MDATNCAETGHGRRLGALAMTAVGATLLGAVGPAAGSAQAEGAGASCTGALVVVPGTFDPGGNDMRQIWDRPDRADYEHILVDYPATLWPLGAIGYNAVLRSAPGRHGHRPRHRTVDDRSAARLDDDRGA